MLIFLNGPMVSLVSSLFDLQTLVYLGMNTAKACARIYTQGVSSVFKYS